MNYKFIYIYDLKTNKKLNILSIQTDTKKHGSAPVLLL